MPLSTIHDLLHLLQTEPSPFFKSISCSNLPVYIYGYSIFPSVLYTLLSLLHIKLLLAYVILCHLCPIVCLFVHFISFISSLFDCFVSHVWKKPLLFWLRLWLFPIHLEKSRYVRIIQLVDYSSAFNIHPLASGISYISNRKHAGIYCYIHELLQSLEDKVLVVMVYFLVHILTRKRSNTQGHFNCLID